MSGNIFNVAPQYQPIVRQIGLDADAVFTHPDIVVWRSIRERENCTLDATLVDGRAIRLHVKRYHPTRGGSPADEEARGIRALQAESIPTVPLVAWGHVADGRSFVISEDLAGYMPADRLLVDGLGTDDADRLLDATADLSARLHIAGLHHRDLYLCHFFARVAADEIDLKLIDAARVRRLPAWPFRQRWIVKDLAQFWYSTRSLPVDDGRRERWLARYAAARKVSDVAGLRTAIERKADRIARHDLRLNALQAGRNISIPR